MENKQIKISNKINTKITFSLEPEGTIVELSPGQTLLVELIQSENNPVIDLQIDDFDNGLCISIWPENGIYQIKD